jgi:cell division protein FtsI (penicillin-binding protein 3)
VVANQKLNWRGTMKARVTIAAVVMVVWALVIQARLVHLQVFRYDELRAQADRQQSYRRELPGRRGEILDRNGRVLAYSVVTDTVYAVPGDISDRPGAVAGLCKALGCDSDARAQLTARLARNKDFVYVRRRVTPAQAKRVKELAIEGVGFLKEDERFYPNRELAAHVLGFVGTEHKGLGGIESTYDSLITGSAGSVRVQKDFTTHVEKQPTVGSALELTIDERIQHLTERELRRGVLENRAEAGTAIVMDPQTGEILAMANYPTFNPNSFASFPASQRRNRAVQDVYEPGSTFKIVTASAALEQGVVDPDDVIDVSGGKIVFGPGDVVRDTHDYKRLTFSDVIVKSSNVGAIKVAQRLGAERMTEYVRRFGFGRPASRQDFPSETGGIVWSAERLKDRALARVSIGYQVAVNALQVATAASSIANGGELVRPRMVRAVIRDGQRLVVPRAVINRTVPPRVASEMTAMMEGVVSDGTGTMAQIPGYTVAGKTGTATKWKDGQYIPTEHNASFVGFVPSRAPRFTIIVVIDAPKGPNGYYGGPVAAPVFKRIAEGALRYGRIPPTLNPAPPVVVQRGTGGAHEQPVSNVEAPPRRIAAVAAARRDGLFPDLSGLSAREAAGALARLGFAPRMLGSGLVVTQKPAAGTPLDGGARVTLWLDRQPLSDSPDGSAP